MKLLVYTTLALLLLLLLSSSSFETGSAVVPPPPGFCAGKCKVRCAKAGVHDRCLKYCGLCCEDCSCVPSGTYGNKDECPCYRDMFAKGDKSRPKCP